MSSSELLISGIAQDAEAEARKIIKEAEQTAAERKTATAKQAASILEEARRKAAAQAEALRKQMASATKMETKRIALRVREQAIRIVLDQVREKVEGLIGTPEYRETLLGWIVEAAMGLALPEAAVNASAREREIIEEGLLAEAEKRVLEVTGAKVRLSKAEGAPLAAQGVVLTGRSERRLQFNNQVATRLLRAQTEIRKIIYDALWKNES